ncbi:MAG: dihydrolipoamide acetyltransferase family protein [Phycisphaeraceae bacterium]
MEFKVPELGEGVYEAELIEWRVKVGDRVSHGDVLAEVMTDKANMELPSPFEGEITGLSAQAGDMIKVGQQVLSYDAVTQAAQAKEEDEPAGREVEGAQREEEQAGEEPVPLHEATVQRTTSEITPSKRKSMPPSRARTKASPAVRHMAHELGIDLARVEGTGPAGRVLIKDLAGKHDGIAHDTERSRDRPAATLAASLDLGSPGTRMTLRGVRRRIAERMIEAVRTIPHYSYMDECDLTELVRLRDELSRTDESGHPRLTYLPFFVKAAAHALRQVPLVNATFDDDAGEVTLHDRYDIGIATATPQGLIVPVVRDADRKDVFTLARDIERMTAAARAGRAKLADLQRGTFTITSIGSIGGLMATPIIHRPQVAIMAIGRIQRRPVYDDAGNLRPADLVHLSFSFDHRIVDGAIGAVFANALIDQLRHPAMLLLTPQAD